MDKKVFHIKAIVYFVFFFSLTFRCICSDKQSNEIAIAKYFLKNLIQKKYEIAFNQIDTTYWRQYTPQFIGMQWQSLISMYGDYIKTDSLWEEVTINKSKVFQRMQFKEAYLLMQVNIRKKVITGFTIVPTDKNYLYKLPSYDRKNYSELQVTIPSEKGILLPGILTIPKDALSTIPIVVFVHGSGPANKDEEIGPNKPFKDLAIGLASKGIASLRYEKRTWEFKDEMVLTKDSTTIFEETITDAVYAAKFGAKQPKIDSTKVFVLGHSLGGMCAPKIAEMNPQVAGIIMLAAPARPSDSLMIEQLNYIAKLDSSNVKIQMLKNMINYQVSVLNSDTFSLKTSSILLPFSLPAKYWLSLKRYNQFITFKLIEKPALILQGERDYQVTVKDFKRWSTAKRNNVELKLYPKLNHLFFEGEGLCTPQEYEQQRNVAFYVIEDIAEWIKN